MLPLMLLLLLSTLMLSSLRFPVVCFDLKFFSKQNVENANILKDAGWAGLAFAPSATTKPIFQGLQYFSHDFFLIVAFLFGTNITLSSCMKLFVYRISGQ